MSINVSMEKLLLLLPDLISWTVPGLLLVFGYRLQKYEERSSKNETISIILAIFYSFIIRYTVMAILVRRNVYSNVWLAVWSCVAGFLLGSLFGFILNRRWISKLSENYFNLTINSNPFYDLADKKTGCYIRVCLNESNNEYIYGIYRNCYNRGSEDWIVVENAVKIKGEFNPDTEKNIINVVRREKNITKRLINSKEIKYVEFVYVGKKMILLQIMAMAMKSNMNSISDVFSVLEANVLL